jgi:Flp pilus assembly protein TadD
MKPSSKSPSQSQLNNVIEQYQNERFGDAEKLAKSITKEFPNHQLAWKILGAVFGRTGRNTEALNAFRKSVESAPEDAEAHYNLGIMLQEMDKLE